MAKKVPMDEMKEYRKESIKSRWEKLDSDRLVLLDRARDCAKLTVPSLLPPNHHIEQNVLPTPYQSVGARAVNTLAAKLLMALLPPNTPFFRFIPDETALEEIKKQDAKILTEIETKLASSERNITNEVERQALRVPTFEYLRLLVATGNALLYKPEGKLKTFRLDQYVVKRDPLGHPLEIIVKESIAKKALPPEIQKLITKEEGCETVDLFTSVELEEDGLYYTRQEVEGILIPDSIGTYTKETMPWLPQRWSAIAGEDYGRGPVELYLGDLRSLEALTQAIVEGSAAASKMVFLVNPNGNTRMRDVAKAESGDFKPGMATDVTVLQANKFNDFRVAKEVADEITNRLAQAFLMSSSVTRNAERVTAEEIRYMAGELEDVLGGTYSVLSQEFQLPLVKLLMKEKSISFPKDLVAPGIVTGMEALGRGHDYDKLVRFAQTIGELYGPQIVAERTNIDEMLTRIANSLSIDAKGIIKTDEEMAAAQQQTMMQQTVAQGGQALGQAGGAMLAQQLANQGAQQ